MLHKPSCPHSQESYASRLRVKTVMLPRWLSVKNPPANAGDVGSIPGLGRFPGEGNGYPFQYSGLENPMDRGAWQATIHGVAKSRTGLSDFHFPCWLSVKNPPANAGDLGLISGPGRSPGEGIGYPLQYSCLENSTDRGVWRATVHGVAKGRTQLSGFQFHYHLPI